MERMLGDRRAVLALVGPALLIYTVVMLVPIVWSMGYTAYDGNVITGFEFVGLENFREFVGDPNAWQATWFTIRYAVVLTVLQVGLGFALSVMYVFWLRRSGAIVRTLVFFPVVLPTVAVALMFRRLFEIAPTTGPVNVFLQVIGLDAVDWFGAATPAFAIIILMDLWRSMGFYAVLLYTGILDIPDEVIESARVDGASGWRLVRHIVVPLSYPVLFSALIFSINGTLKVFDSVVALTNGGPAGQTTPLTVLMFRTAFTFTEYGYGSTIAFMLTLIALVVTVMIFRLSQRDLSSAEANV